MAATVTKSPPSLIPPVGPTLVAPSHSHPSTRPPPSTSPSTSSRSSPRRPPRVHYYPIAGCIAEPVQGEPEVEYTREGVWFVEAEVSCALEEARNLDHPLCIPKEELLPRPPLEVRLEDTVLLATEVEEEVGGTTEGSGEEASGDGRERRRRCVRGGRGPHRV